MKPLLSFLFLLSVTAGLIAQKDETLFSGVERSGAWGSPLFEYLDPGSDIQVNRGGGGAVVLNDFFLGGYGMGSMDATKRIDSEGIQDKIRFKHGGFWLGYTPLQQKVLHPYGSVRMGWGKARRSATDLQTNQLVGEGDDELFVLTPEAGLELNVFSFCRIAATASYRWVNGLDNLGNFRDSDLSGMGATLTLKFGAFGRD
ncbi:MAG: hypothetical protein RLY31_677 [Bacteroidota bacterium]|jgi:hypothetical protein